MVKRRSLDDALSTDELAVYAPDEKSRHSPTTPAPSTPGAPLTTPRAPAPGNSPPEGHTSPLEARGPAGMRQPQHQGFSRDESASKRAAMERELDLVEPFSLQDIVDEAMADWLRKEGYLR